MADDSFTLAVFATSWGMYQERLTAAVAALTAEQVALRAAPDLRSIGEIALHIVGCRMYWFTEFLGEDGAVAGGGVVGMGVGDERAGDGADGVDEEAARRAVEALGAGDEEVGGTHGLGCGATTPVAKVSDG